MNLETAKSRGHIDAALTDLAEAGRLCDLLVVCTPVDRIVDDVPQLPPARAAPAR